MSIVTRLIRLEQTLGTETGCTATVLITDRAGADFLASPEGTDYSNDTDLVITTGTFTNHQFNRSLRPADEATITNLRKEYNTVIVHTIDGYHLRLIDKAYRETIT